MALIVSGVLPGFLTASLAPRIDADFGFGKSDLGVTVAVFYALCTIGSTPAGQLVDRLGARVTLRLAGATSAAGALIVAGVARSPAVLTVGLGVAAVGNALGGPAVSELLRRGVVGRRHGLAFGAQQAGAPLGSLTAGMTLPLIAIPLGWRWGFVLAAALALVAGAVASALAAPTGGDGASRQAERPAPRHRSAVRLLAASAVLASVANIGMVAFLVVYAVDHGMSEGQAGLVLAAVSLGAAAGRIALGAVADRPRTDALRLTAAMLAVSALGYLVLISAEPLGILAGALLAGTIGWSWPGTFTLAVVERSPEAPGWAVGVMMAGLFGGAVAGPLLVGLLAGGGGFTIAWIVCAVAALGAAAAAARVPAAG